MSQTKLLIQNQSKLCSQITYGVCSLDTRNRKLNQNPKVASHWPRGQDKTLSKLIDYCFDSELFRLNVYKHNLPMDYMYYIIQSSIYPKYNFTKRLNLQMFGHQNIGVSDALISLRSMFTAFRCFSGECFADSGESGLAIDGKRWTIGIWGYFRIMRSTQ